MRIATMRQPAWLAHAWGELGQREIPGPSSNPRIADYIRRAGHPIHADDATPWCAAFVAACLEHSGHSSTGSLLARSYLSWGRPADAPEAGAVAVLSRGADPALGHVGFLIGLTDDKVVLLGGNQSDAVTVEAFARSRLLGLRLPADTQPEALPSTQTPQATPAASPVPSSHPSAFEWSLVRILEFEGGYSDDPFDPGGPTNKGITLSTYARFTDTEVDAASYPRLKSALRVISDADVSHIYRDRYWQPARCPDLPRGLDHFHFDAAVNQGVTGAARMLQEALGVVTDGIIGPVTAGAAAAQPVERVLQSYAAIRRRRYRGLSHFWRFGRGWLARVDKALTQAQSLASSRPSVRPEGGDEPLREPPTPPIQTRKDDTIMPDSTPITIPSSTSDAKWWGSSLTIWGALLTAISTVLPAILSSFGIDLPGPLLAQLGTDIMTAVQAAGGLAGTIMTILGRIRASVPIERRAIAVRL
jgi:uncharacterized protein (TIGR02594 family)